MKIGEILLKCNTVFNNEGIYLFAEFDGTSFLINQTDLSGLVVDVPLASNSLVDCNINFWNVQLLSNKVKDTIGSAITTILETPESMLYPEKKYHLRWVDDDNGKPNYLEYSNGIWGWHWDSGLEAKTYTEKELQQLKVNNPRLAPAIDAMKEVVEDECGKDGNDDLSKGN